MSFNEMNKIERHDQPRALKSDRRTPSPPKSDSDGQNIVELNRPTKSNNNIDLPPALIDVPTTYQEIVNWKIKTNINRTKTTDGMRNALKKISAINSGCNLWFNKAIRLNNDIHMLLQDPVSSLKNNDRYGYMRRLPLAIFHTIDDQTTDR
eukprot:UN02649